MPGGTQKHKYEREITEILERMEREEPRGERVRRQARGGFWQRWQRWRLQATRARRASVGRQSGYPPGWTWIGATLAAGVVGLLLRALAPGALGAILGVVCAVLMVALFFSPLLRRLTGPPDIDTSATWRGRPVVDFKPRGGLLAQARYYWRRFRSGRGRRF